MDWLANAATARRHDELANQIAKLYLLPPRSNINSGAHSAANSILLSSCVITSWLVNVICGRNSLSLSEFRRRVSSKNSNLFSRCVFRGNFYHRLSHGMATVTMRLHIRSYDSHSDSNALNQKLMFDRQLITSKWFTLPRRCFANQVGAEFSRRVKRMNYVRNSNAFCSTSNEK